MPFGWSSSFDGTNFKERLSIAISILAFCISITEVDANILSHWYGLNVTNSVIVERMLWKDWRPGFIEHADSLLGMH